MCFRGKEGMRAAEIDSAVSRKLILESKKLFGEEDSGKNVFSELSSLKTLLENKLVRLEKITETLTKHCSECKRRFKTG